MKIIYIPTKYLKVLKVIAKKSGLPIRKLVTNFLNWRLGEHLKNVLKQIRNDTYNY